MPGKARSLCCWCWDSNKASLSATKKRGYNFISIVDFLRICLLLGKLWPAYNMIEKSHISQHYEINWRLTWNVQNDLKEQKYNPSNEPFWFFCIIHSSRHVSCLEGDHVSTDALQRGYNSHQPKREIPSIKWPKSHKEPLSTLSKNWGEPNLFLWHLLLATESHLHDFWVLFSASPNFMVLLARINGKALQASLNPVKEIQWIRAVNPIEQLTESVIPWLQGGKSREFRSLQAHQSDCHL